MYTIDPNIVKYVGLINKNIYTLEDYKITAVKHYVIKSKNLSKTCKIFECSVF